MEASSETSIVMKYYGNDTHEGAHFPFNFDLVNVRAGAKADQLKSLIDTYMSSVPEGRVPNWVVSYSRYSFTFTIIGLFLSHRRNFDRSH